MYLIFVLKDLLKNLEFKMKQAILNETRFINETRLKNQVLLDFLLRYMTACPSRHI
jgi:hypothetical protein